MQKRFMGWSLVILFLLAVPAWAGAPTAAVENTVTRVLDVLKDPQLKGPQAKEAKTQKLRVIYKDMFDEMEFSRRTLTRNWNKFTPDQRREFVDLFEQVMEKTYLDRILEYSNEKVVFYKETLIGDDKAEVQSKIITSSKEVPIYYRMILKSGKWKVYDVVVENVSLVQNYRTQFSEILASGTPEDLLATLRKKVKTH
ncbi:MAG: ABC transporter substrate-binding protein [Deltaproteobacteria bacterium]|jgi:phospholipid transport system substrate-binding protein|nr:ABC transporter substrate-binding protein [Syntrophaceae bacterium]